MLYFYIVVSWVKSIPEKPHKGGKNMSFDDFDYESLRSDLMDNYGTAKKEDVEKQEQAQKEAKTYNPLID